MDRPAIGLALHPDDEYLERLMGLYEREAELLELAPETCWALDERGELIANGFHARFLALGRRLGLPFVAHGVGLSPGSVGDAERRARGLARIAADHAQFGFHWYTDHLGATRLDGLELTLPIGTPMTTAAAAVTRGHLDELRRIVPRVGLENTALYFTVGDPLAEPAFFSQILGDVHHLLLDLHNLHTMAENLGFDPDAYLARLDLSRVIEVHLSGGRDSDPAWLGSGRALRLDSHDDLVPEPVWRLFERVLPRCPALRAVIVERMEGTVGPGDELALRDELRRARRLVELHHRPGPVADAPPSATAPSPAQRDELRAYERRMARALRSRDPVAALRPDPARDPVAALRPDLGAAARADLALDPDGLRLSALFIARLRFERLQHGDLAAARWFDADPAGFTAAFRRYAAEVPPTAAFPQEEAALFRRWRADVFGDMSY